AAPYVTFLTDGGNADGKPNSGRPVLTAALNYGCQVPRSIIAVAASAPLERHRDVAWHPAGEIDNFDPQLVSAGAEILRPKLIDLLGHAGQRVFPARLLLIDGAPLVRAQLVREPVHLHLGLAVGHRALDDLDRAPNALFIGYSRWLHEMIEQSLFLG